MKGYDSYKNSGIDWIGEIPNNWIVSKAKFVSKFRMGQTILKEDLIENGKFPVYSATEGDHFFGYVNNSNFLLEQGDIVIPARGNSIGYVVLVKEPSVSTQTTIASFVNKRKVYPNFLYYFYKGFKSVLFHFDETAIPQITVNQVENNQILLPSLEEQTQIAAFLDYKTNLIDATIEKKKRLIELLKEKRQAVINEAVTKGLNPNVSMKDSGVEWLGEIPEHWEVAKLKYNATISFSSVDRHEYKEEMNVSICHYPDAYKNDKINSQTILSTGTCTELEFEKFQLKKNQVIITKDSESANDIGVPTYVEETLENAVCGYHLAILEPQSNRIHGEFLFRFIQTSNVAIYFENNSNGVTRFGLGKPKIENLFVVIPSIEEQLLIAKFINNQLELIENSISKIKSVIEKLQNYRQSLISEAVTGKIDVRDWQNPKNN